MRRRLAEQNVPVELARLRHYRPEDWGNDAHAGCRYWWASQEWRRLHPGEVIGDDPMSPKPPKYYRLGFPASERAPCESPICNAEHDIGDVI